MYKLWFNSVVKGKEVEDIPLAHPYPVGTKVRMLPDSRYAYQAHDREGVVTESYLDDLGHSTPFTMDMHIYQVMWGNNPDWVNSYRPMDIEAV